MKMVINGIEESKCFQRNKPTVYFSAVFSRAMPSTELSLSLFPCYACCGLSVMIIFVRSTAAVVPKTRLFDYH